MKIALPSRRRGDRTPDMLPAINVVFLLMIFFMMIGSVGLLQDTSALPRAGAAPLAEAGATLALAADGTLVLEGQAVALADLPQALRAWRAAHPGASLQFAAAAEADAALALGVMAQARAAGVARLAFLLRGAAA